MQIEYINRWNKFYILILTTSKHVQSNSLQNIKMYCSTKKKLWKSSVSFFFFVQTYSAQFYITVVICSNQLSTAVVKSNSLQLLKHIFTTSCSRWKWCIKLLSLCENYVFQLFFLALQYYTPHPLSHPHPHPRGIFTFYIPGLCFEYHFLFRYNNFKLFLEGGGGGIKWMEETYSTISS